MIFHLDKGYDLSKIVLTYSMKYHYFKVLVSSDHETYTEIAAITADNYTEYYSGYVCTIDGLSAHNVKYVKILFTGTSSGSAFVNLYEAELYGLIPEKEE